MIERKFVAHNVKEFLIQEFVRQELKNAGHSMTKLIRTPLGVKIAIYSSKPGLIVGRKGENIKSMTEKIKAKFKLENPEIEIHEVENPNLDAQIVAERIASNIERFGSNKFKAIGYSVMQDVLGAGALGIEILISGKIPGARAKSWRFYQGYLKKCGDIAHSGVKRAYTTALTKTGIIGIQVRIMPAELAADLKFEVRGHKESAQESVSTEDKGADTTALAAPLAADAKEVMPEPAEGSDSEAVTAEEEKSKSSKKKTTKRSTASKSTAAPRKRKAKTESEETE